MLTRRDFVKQATLISLAPTVPTFLAQTAAGASPSPDDRILVVLQLDGGNDGLNTVIPYADANYARLRPKLAVEKKRVRRLDDAVGLNPVMRDASELFDDGRLAIVQGVGYPNPNKSHDVSKSIWETARFDPTEHTSYGWIGRALDDGPAPSGALGRSSSARNRCPSPCGAQISRCRLGKFGRHGSRQFVEARRIAKTDDSLFGFVQRSTLDAVVTADRLQQAAKSRPGASAPPYNELAKRLTLIARLIESDFVPRVYYAVQTGYDTHVYQRDTHERLLRATLGGAAILPRRIETVKARRSRRCDDVQRIRPVPTKTRPREPITGPRHRCSWPE